ncbi:MAG: DUF4340 domain-containing protein [Alphaproteobacteria bacterium]|nr:DUF4340 domain-containing protein [Alphaproteobacteria bacterium]
MNPLIMILSFFLLGQFVLASGLGFFANNLSSHFSGTALLSFDAASVTELTIRDNEGKHVALVRTASGWVLSESGNFPADSKKVDTLLNKLTEIKGGPFIATSDGAAKRFRVTDNDFERKLSLEGSVGSLATLYLGTSLGTQKIHVRRAGEVGISQIPFVIWSVSTNSDEWMDGNVLQINSTDVDTLSWGTITIKKLPSEDDHKFKEQKEMAISEKDQISGNEDRSSGAPVWAIFSDEPDHSLPEAIVNKLIGYLERLRISGLLSPSAHDEYDHKNPVFTLKILFKDKEKWIYKLVKRPQEADYAIIASNWTQWMRLPAVIAERLIEVMSDPAFGSVIQNKNAPHVEKAPFKKDVPTVKKRASQKSATSVEKIISQKERHLKGENPLKKENK